MWVVKVVMVGKLKVGLLMCGVLVVVLAVSNVWFFMRVESLGNEINTLETDKSNLQSEVSNLETDKNVLEDQINDLETDKSSLESQISDFEYEITLLQNEIDSLREPQLHRVEVFWTDDHPVVGLPFVNIYGSIFNSGSQSAYSVVYTVRIYDEFDILLKTEEIHLGSITGRSYITFDVNIEYSGDADYISTVLTFD